MANNCKRGLNTSEETKPRVSKVASKPVEKEGRSSSSTSSPEKTEEQSAEAEKGDDTMKVLIDEANRMLRSLQETDPKEKVMVTKNAEDKMSTSKTIGRDQEDHFEALSSLESRLFQPKWAP